MAPALPAPPAVAVIGASGSLGQRVLASLTDAPELDGVLTISRRSPGLDRPGRLVHLGTGPEPLDLAEALDGVRRIVHLTPSPAERPGRSGRSGRSLDLATVLDAAGPDAGVVVVSSAAVYGAWADNAVPLTEGAPTRPNPGFAFAAEKLASEQVLSTWRRRRPQATAAILRPAPAVAEGARSWLAAHLLAASTVESARTDPPAQFLHLDDLASAVATAALSRLDGVANVAPDGWLTGEERRALLRGQARVRVPDGVLGIARRGRQLVRWVPEGIDPYVTESFVVANDRLRRAGWRPSWSSDEALVVAERVPRWTSLNARERQYASLGVAGAVAAGVAGGVAYGLRRLGDR